MLYDFLKLIIIIEILIFGMATIFYVGQYISNKRKYGVSNTKVFFSQIKLLGIIPDKKNEKYKRFKKMLLAVDWNISVEMFYIIKLIIAFTILVVTLAITNTNVNLSMQRIENDLNYGRSVSDQQIEPTEELVRLEKELVLRVRGYLKSINLSPNSSLALDSVRAFIESENVNYDSSSILAKRILNKIRELDLIVDNPVFLLMANLIAFVGYILPNILLALKIGLIQNNKDWEILHCMTVYSTNGKLPPYRIDKLIENMQDVTKIYRTQFEIFKDALRRDDKEELDQIISSTLDDDLLQIFETLVLASEIGLEKTVSNIDDLLDQKVKWLEVNAKKRRQFKFMLAFVPVAFVLLALYVYSMQIFNMINQVVLVDF